MRISKAVSTLSLIGILLQPAAEPLAEVYKWTDEDGRVHYGDKPPVENAETVEIQNPPSDHDPALQQRREKRRRLLEIYNEDRQSQQEQEEAARREREQRKRRCAQASERLQTTRDANFLYEKTDDPQNPHVLSAAERQAEIERLRNAVKKWCD